MANVGANKSGFVSRAPRLGFVGGFDGIRGIGILMVLFDHAYSNLSPSFAGIIDVFFVMSAFLIVTLLIQEYGEHEAISMRKFYARRGIRLLPSAFLCLAAWIVVLALFDRARLGYFLQEAAAAVTYIYNIIFPVGLNFVDPISAVQHSSIGQFWSLAVEEQFYLLIAITVLVCLRRRWMVQLAVGLALVASFITVQRWTGHTGPFFSGPTNSSVLARGISLLWLSRYDSLMWGVGLAVINAKLPHPLPDRWRRWLPRVGALGLAVAAVSMLLASVFLHDLFSKHGVWYPYVPMFPVPGYAGRTWIQFGYTLTALAFCPGDARHGPHPRVVGQQGPVLEADPLHGPDVLHRVRLAHAGVLHHPGSARHERPPGREVACADPGHDRRHRLPSDLLRGRAADAAGQAALRQREAGTGPQHRQDDRRGRGAGARGHRSGNRCGRWNANGIRNADWTRNAHGTRRPSGFRPGFGVGPVTATTQRDPFVSKAPKLGLIGSFDGLRGMGVAMLLVGHALFSYVESWVTIIDAFFVLSGFLITTLLLQEHRSTSNIDLKKFYQRRATRLLPSVFLFVAVWLVISSIATVVGYEPLNIRYVGADALATVTYTYHLFFPNGLYIIEPAIQAHRTMWHLWTLSVEEWFYIVIAGTVLVCVRRHWVKSLGWIMLIGFAAIGVARWFAFTGFFQDDPHMIAGVRMALLQRPDALMMGVALAVLNAHLTAERIEKLRKPLIWLGTVCLVVWALMLNLSSGLVEKLGGPYFEYLPANTSQFTRPHMMATLYWFRFGHTLGALAFTVVLFCLCRYRTWWPSKFWEWHPMQWMGRMSYTLYIWHALPYLLIFSLTGGEDVSLKVQILRTPVLIASAFAVSLPVYYLVEMRVLRMKLKFSAEKEALDLTTGKMVAVDTTTGAVTAEASPGPSVGANGSSTNGSATTGSETSVSVTTGSETNGSATTGSAPRIGDERSGCWPTRAHRADAR